MDFLYRSNPTFSRVHVNPDKFMFIRGPVGSGKSVGCIMQLFFSSLRQTPDSDGVRKTVHAVLRATYPALKTTVVKSWKAWFKDEIHVVYDTPIRANIQMPHPDGQTRMEIEINFIALDREEDISKLQSLELTAAHMNEAAEIPEAVFTMLRGRINRYPPRWDGGGATHPFIVLDYNSVDINHWLYRLAVEDQPPGFTFYAQPPAILMVPQGTPGAIADRDDNWYVVNSDADNLDNQSPDYYPDMIAGADADYLNVFVMNNWGSIRSGRPVYKAYKDNVHCSPKPLSPLKGVPILIGVDVGLTPAAAFVQLTPLGQLIVIDEIVTENTSIQEFANDILWPHIRNNYSKFKFELIVDPAARNRSENDKRSAFDILVGAGLPTRLAKTNEPLKRREAVNFFLRKQMQGVPGFLLSPTCITLQKGFISEYKYSRISTAGLDNKFKEKPEKSIYSHVHDGLQYAAVELTEGLTGKKKRILPSGTNNNRPADTLAGY